MVTPTICHDGKKHNWEKSNYQYSGGKWFVDGWCNKCGSKTNFVRRENPLSERYDRCAEDDGSPCIEIPTIYEKKSRVVWMEIIDKGG